MSQTRLKMEELYLGFVKLIGQETDGLNRYEFIFTDNIDEFWGEDFDIKPAGLCNDIAPDDKYMSEIHIVRTTMKFDLAQKCNCFSMQDCIDGCIALAWENIDDYEEYPEDTGRLVFNFGEPFDEVERKFALRGILLN